MSPNKTELDTLTALDILPVFVQRDLTTAHTISTLRLISPIHILIGTARLRNQSKSLPSNAMLESTEKDERSSFRENNLTVQ